MEEKKEIFDPFENTSEREADRIAAHIRKNEANYHDDPDGDILVDEDTEAPNGMFGDHQDDFDIG